MKFINIFRGRRKFHTVTKETPKYIAERDIAKETGNDDRKLFHANYLKHEKELLEFNENEKLITNQNQDDDE